MWAMLKLKFRLMYNNKTLYLVMIAMAIFLSGVFGNSFGGYKPTVAVVGTDPILLKSDLMMSLANQYGYKVKLMDETKAQEALSNRSVMATLKMPATYPLTGSIEMGYWTDSVEIMELTQILETQIESAANIENLQGQIATLTGDATLSKEQVKVTFSEHWQYKKPLTVEKIVLDSDYAGYSQNLQSLVGMTIFFLTYSVLFTVGDMLEDQRLKTMNRFMVSPVNRWHILIGNFLPGFLIGFVQMVIMVLSGKYLFGIDWGSGIPAVLMVSVTYVFAIAALSLFVVSLVRSMGQLGALSPVILTGMAMLGGCMWPLEIVTSKIMLTMADFTPHKWAMGAIINIVQTGALSTATFEAMGILIVMGLVLFVLGERILYRKSQSAL